MDYPQSNLYLQWANYYLGWFYQNQISNNLNQSRQNIDQIYSIIINRYPHLLQLLERYNIPPAIIQVLTRRIIEFTITNAPNVPGDLNRKVNILYRSFVDENQRLLLALKVIGVPENVLERYIKGVIRATLEIIDHNDSNINAETERLLRLFERRFPNFLGLTNIYNIPRRNARRIVSDIIEFTLRNIDRISPIGSIQSRADQMLLLLDRERPQLIETMIRQGVPANRAENITRRIIVFTLRNGQL